MRVFLDALALHSGGARTHLKSILSQRVSNKPEVSVLATRALWNEAGLDGLAELVLAPEGARGVAYRIAWRLARLGPLVQHHRADVYFDPGGGAPSLPVPRATMVRNMLPFDPRVRQWYGRFSYQGARLAALKCRTLAAVGEADGVIFISEWSKAVVTGLLGRQPRQACVIPHGVERRETSRCPSNFPPNILYVSDIGPYKRQEEVMRAYDLARERGAKLGALVLAGSFTHAPYAKHLAVVSKGLRYGQDIRMTGWLGRRELAQAVADADILVFASSVECCPNIVLELLLSGKPIICSLEPPMPEFAGDGVLYADPASPSAMADALSRVTRLTDIERLALTSRASERARAYDWAETARRTWDFLAMVG